MVKTNVVSRFETCRSVVVGWCAWCGRCTMYNNLSVYAPTADKLIRLEAALLKYNGRMTGFMDWKYLNEEQISHLEQSNNEAEIKKLLVNAFGIYTYPKKKQNILCVYHFFNYA